MTTKSASPTRRGRRTRTRSRRQTARPVVTDETKPSRRQSRRLVYVLAFLVTVTVALLGGQWILHRPYFCVQHVVVIGNAHESTTMIEQATGLAQHPAMLSLSASHVQRIVEAFPWVAHAVVVQRWPNTVTIRVSETSAVAVSAKGAGWVYVGRNGAELGPAPASANLPTLVSQVAGSQWPFTSTAVSGVTVADALPVTLAPQVRQIVVSAQGAVSLVLTTPVRFDLGPPTELSAKFVAIASVIKSTTLVPGDVVDVSIPTEVAVTPPG